MPQQDSKVSRQRGVMLTTVGYKKLFHAKISQEIEQNARLTLDYFSQQTGLTANTLSKIFSRSAPVDKRSLHTCFASLNLNLEDQDYLAVLPSLASPARFYSGEGNKEISKNP